MFIVILLFFFNDTATTEIYTLSLHDALPISGAVRRQHDDAVVVLPDPQLPGRADHAGGDVPVRLARRSEEHTSELQSRQYLVCRLLLEKKKQTRRRISPPKHLSSSRT